MEWAANELFPFMYFQVHCLQLVEVFFYGHTLATHKLTHLLINRVCVCLRLC